jgi:hypothetical protein
MGLNRHTMMETDSPLDPARGNSFGGLEKQQLSTGLDINLNLILIE